MSRWWNTTIRARLTLSYAGAFFLAGAILIALTYIFLGQSLDRQLATRVGNTEQHITAYLSQANAHAGPRAAQLKATLRTQFEQDRDEALRRMLIWSLASLGVVGVGAGGFGWLLADRALRPLKQITSTARRVADRSLHERIALDGPGDEIKDLADTFDAMLERLDRSFDGQRRFVANASHELRTPLTLNRTLIEVALDTPDVPRSTRQLGTTLLEINRRHERLIDGLLVLVSGEQRLTEHTVVDLADVVRHVATASSHAAREARVEVRPDLATAPVAGDPVLLERLAYNLLDNAIRYNVAEHGWVSVTTGTVDDHVVLTVENTGPTVPEYDVGGLFEPFRRLASTDRLTEAGPASAGRGAGLGLSIVRSVAHAHGGQVHARPRPDGGLFVCVQLPPPQPDGEHPVGSAAAEGTT
ncbi:sensor histidine kinase [Flindersiella endophytica]